MVNIGPETVIVPAEIGVAGDAFVQSVTVHGPIVDWEQTLPPFAKAPVSAVLSPRSDTTTTPVPSGGGTTSVEPQPMTKHAIPAAMIVRFPTNMSRCYR